MENVKEQNIISKHETVTPSANFVSPTKHSMSPVAPSVFTDEAGDIRLIIGGTGGIKTITSIAYVSTNSFSRNILLALVSTYSQQFVVISSTATRLQLQCHMDNYYTCSYLEGSFKETDIQILYKKYDW